jgi:hypothetical protein
MSACTFVPQIRMFLFGFVRAVYVHACQRIPVEALESEEYPLTISAPSRMRWRKFFEISNCAAAL